MAAVLDEVTLGTTVRLTLRVEDVNGRIIEPEAIDVDYKLVPHGTRESVTPTFDRGVGIVEFRPSVAGTYIVRVSVTDPVQVVNQGYIRVVPLID